MFKNTLIYKEHFKICNRLIRTINTQLSINTILKTKNVGDEVKVQGWVKSMRKMKENIFFDVNDGSCMKPLQVLIPNASKPKKLFPGSSIEVTGLLNETPKGQLELNANELKILGECDLNEGYPFAPKKSYAAEYVREYLHLRSRTNKFSSMLRVRDAATIAIHDFFHTDGFINIHTPILTSNDCEGAGEVFTVYPENKSMLTNMIKPNVKPEEAYFDKKVYLTVSGQMHLEAVAHGLSKVYTFGPTFRAENSRSRLHLSEFYMLEAEIAFINKLEQLIHTIESLIKAITNNIVNKCNEDILRCQGENQVDLSWVNKSFPIITYEEATKIVGTGCDGGFTKDEEMFIVKHCGGIPTFIINWPKNQKPFYMRECEDNSNNVAALDLLGPNIGEIVGGSLRENNINKLKEALPHDNLNWYLDLRKFGGVPSGGFGLGFERYLQLILGFNSIKDVIPFPRWPHNCNL